MLDDAVEEGGEGACIAKTALVDLIEDLGELGLELVMIVEMRVAKILDVFCEITEEEDVLFTDFAGDLDLGVVSMIRLGNWNVSTYVGTIAGTDDQATVQAELHITGSRSFRTSCGNVFGDVAGRGDDFSLADVVVLQKDDLQQVSNVRVVVHDISNLVDEMDDGLGHPISRCCLSTKNRHTRSKLFSLLGRQALDLQVSVDDTEDIELLALVLVDTLYLHIEECSRVDSDTIVLLDVFRKAYLYKFSISTEYSTIEDAYFVSVFNLTELLSELFVVDKCF